MPRVADAGYWTEARQVIIPAVLAALREKSNPSSDPLAAATFRLGFARSHAGAHAEAEGHFRDALKLQTEADGKHWTAAKDKAWLGFALPHQKTYAAAELLLLEAHAQVIERLAPMPLRERPDKAAEWRDHRGNK